MAERGMVRGSKGGLGQSAVAGPGRGKGAQRAQRTTALLVAVVAVFICAWLPLNLLNVLLDLGLYATLFG